MESLTPFWSLILAGVSLKTANPAAQETLPVATDKEE
jgi:hypothetical protein